MSEEKCFEGTHTWLDKRCRDCSKPTPNFGDALKEVFALRACRKERDEVSKSYANVHRMLMEHQEVIIPLKKQRDEAMAFQFNSMPGKEILDLKFDLKSSQAKVEERDKIIVAKDEFLRRLSESSDLAWIHAGGRHPLSPEMAADLGNALSLTPSSLRDKVLVEREAWETLKHSHQGPGDKCGDCGLDIRDSIHTALAPGAPEKTRGA